MYNWSHIDEDAMKKENPAKYSLWRITQQINWGLGENKLDKSEVKKAWPKIKNDIFPYRRRLFEFLLWDKIYSLPTNLRLWNKSRQKKT